MYYGSGIEATTLHSLGGLANTSWGIDAPVKISFSRGNIFTAAGIEVSK